MSPDDPGRQGGAGAPSGPPEYKLYRSRPRWFKAPGRAGEPGFDELATVLRAAGIGARLEVVSTEGRGTTVFLFGPN